MNTARTKIRQIILSNLSIILIVTLVALIFIYLLSLQIKKQNQNLLEKQTLLFVAQTRSGGQSQLSADFEKVGENLPNIEKALPVSDNLLEYLSDLDITSKNLGLISTISIQQASSPQPILEGKVLPVDFTIQLQGNLAGVKMYLDAVERLPYYTKILSLDGSSDKGIQNSGNFNIKAQVLTKVAKPASP